MIFHISTMKLAIVNIVIVVHVIMGMQSLAESLSIMNLLVSDAMVTPYLSYSVHAWYSLYPIGLNLHSCEASCFLW